MDYDPRVGGHGLPHDPFLALVVPRPIGWITTIDVTGVDNVAPYSFFNAVASRPPVVIFASNPRKDSQANAEETGEFVVNIATSPLKEFMNATSVRAQHGISEAEIVGLELVPSIKVRPRRIKASPAALECRYVQTVPIPSGGAIVIGEVIHVHIDDAVIVDGAVSVERLQPIARLGYMDYSTIGERFRMERPK